MGWPLPPTGGSGLLKRSWAMAYLQLRMSIKLGRKAESVDVDSEDHLQASLVVCRIVLPKGTDPDAAARDVREALASLWSRKEVSFLETLVTLLWRRVETLVLADQAVSFESASDRLRRRAEKMFETDDPRIAAPAIDETTKLQPDSVFGFAMRTFTREAARVVVFKPSQARTEAGASRRAKDSHLPAPAPEGRSLIARTDAQSLKKLLPRFDPARAKVMTLSTGLEVIIVPRPGFPVAAVAVGFRGGGAAGPPGVANVALKSASWFAPSEGGASDWAMAWQSRLDPDGVVEEIVAGSRVLPNVLAQIRTSLDTTWPDRARFSGFRDQLPEIETRQAGLRAIAARQFWQAVLPTYARAQAPTVAELEGVTFEEAHEWLEETRTSSNTVVVMAGDFDEKVAAELADHWLGSWTGRVSRGLIPAPLPPTPPASGTAPKVAIIDEAGPQVEVLFGCRLPPTDQHGEAVNDVLASVVSTRILAPFRDQLGASYGFGAGTLRLRGGAAALQAEGLIDGAALPSALTSIRDGIEALAGQRLDDESLALARWEAARQKTLSMETSRAVAATVLRARMLGDPLDSISSYPNRLAAVASGDVQAAARHSADSIVVLLSGSLQTLTKAIPKGWERLREAQ